MGPLLFDLGFGPFRWVCLSGLHADLLKTDRAAMECIDPERSGQDRDNWVWIRDAEKNRLVVGTQARILYQDAEGRLKIALRFNEMVRNGEIDGGGVGIGKAINGGFGMVLDGSERVDEVLRSAILWDVMGGVARRSWARNTNAMKTVKEFNINHSQEYKITEPYLVNERLLNDII